MRCVFLSILLFSSVQHSSGQFNTVVRSKNTITLKNYIVEEEKQTKEPVVIDSVSSIEEQPEPQGEKRKLLHLPLKKLIINSGYGYRKDPINGKRKFHYGVDYAADTDDVYAIMPGKIEEVGFDKKGLGNFVKIKHGDFLVTYGHLYTSIGSKGDFVNAGDVIGITGNTGRSTGEHLHLSMKYKNRNINPLPIIDYIANTLNGLI